EGEIDPFIEATFTKVFRRDICPGRPGPHSHTVSKAARQIQGGTVIPGQVATGAAFGEDVPEASLGVTGDMPGPGGVIAEVEVLAEAALFHPVGIHTDRPASIEGSV